MGTEGKKEERECERREGWMKGLGFENSENTEIKLVKGPKNTKLHMLRSEEHPKAKSFHVWILFCVCVCATPNVTHSFWSRVCMSYPAPQLSLLINTPPRHRKLLSSDVRFDLSFGRPCKASNRRCSDKDNVCQRGEAPPKVIVLVQFSLPQAEPVLALET